MGKSKIEKTLLSVAVALVVTMTVSSAMATPPLKIAGEAGDEEKKPKIEVVFALDTTGSMSGLIAAAKEKIWSIASSMAQAEPTPEIKIGLVAYRDRGDDYVTMRTDLTTDLDAIYGTLMEYEASGGGDGPESVNQALHEAVNRMSWSKADDTYRVIFLVGDYPPHMDYDDDVPYQKSCKRAAKKGIIVNAIQCGGHSRTTKFWKKIALLAEGEYFKVDQSGGAIATDTPYDEELARLGRELDETRVYYGSVKVKAKAKRREKLSKKFSSKASKGARARRTAFNASKAGKDNFLGENELVDALDSGEVKLEELKDDDLPEEMQEMTEEEREKFVAEKVKKRKAIKKKIATVTKKRRKHIEKDLAKKKDKGKGALSQKVYDTVRKQASKKKITFESDLAAH